MGPDMVGNGTSPEVADCRIIGSPFLDAGVAALAPSNLPNAADSQLTDLRIAELTSPKHSGWRRKVKELMRRGISLDSVFDFYKQLFAEMPNFDPRRSTTRDVVRCAIIPWSSSATLMASHAPYNCAYAAVASCGDDRLPDCMVTHHWANLFTHMLAAMIADALDQPLFDKIAEQLCSSEGIASLRAEVHAAGTLDRVYWICAFSVNQHCSICGSTGSNIELDTVTGEPFALCHCGTPKHFVGDLCEMNKFNDMMQALQLARSEFRQVIAVDKEFCVFNRAWCVAELVEAHKSNITQCLKIFSHDAVRENRSKLQGLDVRYCQASRAEDRDTILAGIENIDQFNANLRELILNRDHGLISTWGRSFTKAVTDYFRWGEFSYEMSLELSEALTPQSFVNFLILTFSPLPIPLMWVAAPLREMTGSWQFDWVYWVCHFIAMGACFNIFPFCFAHFTRTQVTKHMAGRMICWDLTMDILTMACTFAAGIIFDVFPVPFTPILQSIAGAALLPSLCFIVPYSQRASAKFFTRSVWSLLLCIAIMLIFAIAFPLLNALLVHASLGWQIVLLGSFLVQKLFFEWLVTRAVKYLGTDALPAAMYISTCCYEVNLCIALSGPDASWVILVELLLFDTLENWYHVISLMRRGKSTDSGEMVVMAELVLREFLELVIPALFLIIVSASRRFNVRTNHLVCNLDEASMSRTQTFLLIDIGIEFVLAVVVGVVLELRGHSPLRLLGRLIDTHLYVFLPVSVCVATFYFQLWHSHLGVDLTFSFPWLEDGHGSWRCGLYWD